MWTARAVNSMSLDIIQANSTSVDACWPLLGKRLRGSIQLCDCKTLYLLDIPRK